MMVQYSKDYDALFCNYHDCYATIDTTPIDSLEWQIYTVTYNRLCIINRKPPPL